MRTIVDLQAINKFLLEDFQSLDSKPSLINSIRLRPKMTNV